MRDDHTPTEPTTGTGSAAPSATGTVTRTDAHARSFGAVADDYERGRPGYPATIAAWLVPEDARRVVDLGAGTGKFTRTLVPLAAEVVAVEPDPGMRARFADALPEVPVLDGSGEHLPLEDGSVDAVLVAQAWHWVDVDAASREVARVLRPGGVLGLVWNLRDETVPWVAALGDAMTTGQGHPETALRPVVAAPFAGLEHHAVDWVHEQSRADVVAMVASRSYVSTLPPDERDAVLRRVTDLLDTHPALRGRDTVPVPYTAHAFRATRP